MKRQKAIMLVFAFVAGAVFAEFKAGFARVDATPPLGIPIVGYFHKRVADGVLDPLNVECVAVSDSTNSALIYCVDDLGLGRGFITKAFTAITAATSVPRERIYIHATHTHTGPATWKSVNFTKEENRLISLYLDTRIAKMAEAGKMALADMAPAKIGVAKTVCRNVSFIRRYRMKDGSVRTNPGITNPNVKEPLGTPDETLQLVRFRRTGAPDIAIVNFGTHPDCIGGTKYSADWPGVVRNTFEAAVGDGLAFAGLPCEPFVDIGRAIKKRSPFRTTIITCLTNDSVGYIASTKAHADGGYEGLSSWLAAPTGDLLVDAQVKQLTSLKENSKGDSTSNPKP